MADLWLPGFDRVESAHGRGGTMLPDVPPRWVGHSTQGYSKDPHGQAAAHRAPPHTWVTLPSHKYKPCQRIQIVPLNRSAFALKHEPGDPETNKAGALQTEVEGMSINFDGQPDGDPFEVTREDLEWLAEFVVGPICDATGVRPAIYVDTADPVRRMSWDTWRRFNGLCCHRNVPGNDHTDMPVDLALISALLVGGQPPTTEDDDMAAVTHPDGHHEMFRVKAGRLEQNWQDPKNRAKWSGWQPMPALPAPAVEVVGATIGPDGNCNVFVQTTLGYVALWFDRATGKWLGPVAAG